MAHFGRIIITLIMLLYGFASTASTAHEELWALYNAGDRQGTLDAATTLLVDRADDRDLRHLVGRCLFDLGRPDAAREHLEFCVDGSSQDWRHAWSLLYLGVIDAVMGRDEQARLAWRQVRDGRTTENVARNAANNLRFFGLDENFDAWPRRETEHLRLAFSPRLVDLDLDAFARRHEEAWAILADWFGGAPQHPVRYIVWFDQEEAREAIGVSGLGFARSELNLIHCHAGQFLLTRATREQVLELGRVQTFEHAATIFGDDLAQWIDEFETALHQPG